MARNKPKTYIVDESVYKNAISIHVNRDKAPSEEPGSRGDYYPNGIDDVGKEIISLIAAQYQDRDERDQMVDWWRFIYETTKGYKKGSGSFEGSANVHTPMVRNAADVLHGEIYRVMTGTEPYIRFRNRKIGVQQDELLKKREAFIHSRLENEIDYPNKIDGTSKRSIIDGTCVLKTCWRRESRIETDAKEINEENLRSLYEGDPNQEKLVMQALAGGVKFGEDTILPGEGRLVMNGPEITADQPDAVRIDFHNFVLYPVRASIDTAVMVGHRIWATENDLWHGVDEGLYDEEAVERLLKEVHPQEWYHTSPFPFEPENQNDSSDLTDPQSGTLRKHAPFELFEVVYKFDANQDGRAEDCVFVVDVQKNIVLRAQPSPYWHGQRPYVDYTPFPREGYFFGYSIVEILEGLQDIDDTVTDQLLDAGTLANSPFITRKNTNNNNLTPSKLYPGLIVDVDEHDDYQLHSWALPSNDNFLDRQVISHMAEMLSGVTDATAGLQPSESRPLGETTALLERAGYRFQVIIERMQRASARLARQIVGLERQYLTPEAEQEITGETPGLFSGISKRELRQGLSIYPLGNNNNTNKQMLLVSAEKMVLAAQTAPEMQEPAQHWEIMRQFVEAHGHRDVETYIQNKEAFVEAQKAKQNQPPTLNPPAMKLDEAFSAAYMLQINPQIAQYLQQAAQLLSGLQAMGIGEDASKNLQAQKQLVDQQAKMKDQQTENTKQAAIQEVQHAKDMAQRDLDFEAESKQRDLDHSQALATLQQQNQQQASISKVRSEQQLAAERIKASRANQNRGNTAGTRRKKSTR